MDFAKISNKRFPKLMEDGDLVVVYERHDALDHFYIRKGQIFQNKFGAFYHSDFIGKPFGSKVYSRTKSKWIYALEPTPELWNAAVHTRTQIVNEIDSSAVLLMLDVHPGCKVVESGTGSGCMTLALARAVNPSGHVYSYEFNAVRAQKAQEEFNKLRVGDLISVTCRDVCGKYSTEQGGFSGLDDNSIDAIFLDLPEPWLALDHAHKILKPGKGICCYSPCIEQVMQTLQKLRALNFHSIKMIEVRQRPMDGRVVELDTLDLGLTEEECLENEKSFRDPNLVHYHPSPAEEEQGDSQTRKKARTDQSIEPERTEEELEAIPDPEDSTNERFLLKREKNRPKSSVNGSYHMPSARPIFTMKGHTAFLTFAIKSFS